MRKYLIINLTSIYLISELFTTLSTTSTSQLQKTKRNQFPSACIQKKYIFAVSKIECGCGVIGSRARLRIWCREAWGFESLHPHSIKPIVAQNLQWVFYCHSLLLHKSHLQQLTTNNQQLK